MDWFPKFTDLTKIPTKVYAVVALVTGAIVLSPTWVLERLRLSDLPPTWAAAIGLVFLFSAAMTFVNCFAWIGEQIKSNKTEKQRKQWVREKLEKLDSEERAILREFLVMNRSTLRLPVDNPTVAGLQSCRIVRQVGTIGEGSRCGILMPFALSDDVRKLWEIEMLGIPQQFFDAEMSLKEEGLKWIDEHRPSFAEHIDHLEQRRSRSQGWRF